MNAPTADVDCRYFRDVESFFVSLRGDPLFISNADWVRIRKWKARGVPLRIVLRGVQDAFDGHRHSFQRHQKVRSLLYCEPSIDAAIDRWRRALTDGIPGKRAADTLLSTLVTRVSDAVSAWGRGGPQFETIVDELARIAERERKHPLAIVEVDQALRALETQAFEVLVQHAGASTVDELRAAALMRTEMYRSRMPVRVYEELVGESVRRRLFEKYKLSRFLLAELE